MNRSSLEFNPEEVAEIEKHKYFLSEKAGYDIGWEAAEEDWLANVRKPTIARSDTPHSSGVRTFLKRVLAKAGMH